MKLRPFSGSCTTSRFSMTSLISAVVDLQERQRALHLDLLGEPLHAEREFQRQRAPDFEDDLVRLR